MLYLTYAKIKNIPPEKLVGMLDVKIFPKEYTDKIMARQSDKSKTESLSALLLLQKTAEYAKKTQKKDFLRKAHIRKDENGKPYFENAKEVSFSLSHSKNTVACVLCTENEGSVGVDAELIEKRRNAQKIADKLFSSEEKARIEESNANERDEVWTLIWTKKEAYIKYIGKNTADISKLDTETAKDVSFESVIFTNEDKKNGKEKYVITVCKEKNDSKTVDRIIEIEL